MIEFNKKKKFFNKKNKTNSTKNKRHKSMQLKKYTLSHSYHWPLFHHPVKSQ